MKSIRNSLLAALATAGVVLTAATVCYLRRGVLLAKTDISKIDR